MRVKRHHGPGPRDAGRARDARRRRRARRGDRAARRARRRERHREARADRGDRRHRHRARTRSRGRWTKARRATRTRATTPKARTTGGEERRARCSRSRPSSRLRRTQTRSGARQRLSVIEQRLDAQTERARRGSPRAPVTSSCRLLAAQLRCAPRRGRRLRHQDRTGLCIAVAARSRSALEPTACPLGTSPSIGSPKAKVTMVMAVEFACPYCRKAWDTVDDLRKKYGNDLRVVYKAVRRASQVDDDRRAGRVRRRAPGQVPRDRRSCCGPRRIDTRRATRPEHRRAREAAKLDMKRYQADLAGPCPTEVTAENAEMRSSASARHRASSSTAATSPARCRSKTSRRSSTRKLAKAERRSRAAFAPEKF